MRAQLLHGPRLDGDSGHITQAEIDALIRRAVHDAPSAFAARADGSSRSTSARCRRNAATSAIPSYRRSVGDVRQHAGATDWTTRNGPPMRRPAARNRRRRTVQRHRAARDGQKPVRHAVDHGKNAASAAEKGNSASSTKCPDQKPTAPRATQNGWVRRAKASSTSGPEPATARTACRSAPPFRARPEPLERWQEAAPTAPKAQTRRRANRRRHQHESNPRAGSTKRTSFRRASFRRRTRCCPARCRGSAKACNGADNSARSAA